MKVLITEVVEAANQLRVSFECECGRGSAFWQGAVPVPGDSRYIELEVPSVLTVGEDLLETTEPPGLRMEGDVPVLVGEVTVAENDGYVRVDLGCGGLDLEVSGDLPVVGRRYRLGPSELQAFDANY